MTQQLSEEQDRDILDEWKKEAGLVDSPDALARFVSHLTEDYGHDYGTIIHAMAAAMNAAMSAVNKSASGGITGFQASCLGWMMIQKLFMVSEGEPLRLVHYENMLYPQYEDKFAKTISKETWEYLQKKANEFLNDKPTGAAPSVTAHMESIRNGSVPFGYTVEEPS